MPKIMRIRTIKPEFFNHDGLYDLEQETGLPIRVAYAGLWCAADREGRFEWQPRRLKPKLLPYDNLDFSRVLDALATRGFIVKYELDGVVYGHIPSFSSHQVINNRERESTLPNPSDCLILDACPTRAPRVPHAGKAEGKGMEGNMEQGKTRAKAAIDLPFDSEKFRQAWADWVQHRKEIKHPLGETSIKKQFKQLLELGEATSIEWINNAILRGWRGIFPPNHTQNQQTKPSVEQRDGMVFFEGKWHKIQQPK